MCEESHIRSMGIRGKTGCIREHVVGCATITGDKRQKRVTVLKRLEQTPFPTEKGRELEMTVEERGEDEPPRLVLEPKEWE
jgi:hypothetical protein